MQKYFISNEELKLNKITSSDVNHIKNVMRYKIGDKFIVSDETSEFLVSITDLSNKEVNFKRVEEIINKNELPSNFYIFQGYPKSDKMEDIIKHSVELGVYKIIPTLMKRSIVKLDSDRISQKEIRFNRISKEASEQSFRKIVPEVSIKRLKDIDFSSFQHKILCYEESAKEGELSNFKSVVKKIEKNQNIAVLIGPEGGIDSDEYESLIAKGFIPCALGPRILRTETAPMYVLSAISYELELK